MSEELEEAIKILENLKDNHFIRDKLERDCRCGGLKIGDIYKMTELNPAIETVLKALKNSISKEAIRKLFDYDKANYIDCMKADNRMEAIREYVKHLEQELLEENK